MVAGTRTPAHTLYLNLNEDDSFTGPLAPAPTLRPGPCPGTPLVGAFPPLTGALPAYTHGVYTARVMVWKLW